MDAINRASTTASIKANIRVNKTYKTKMQPTILITRPQNEARELAAYLENAGFIAIIEPIFSVKIIKNNVDRNIVAAAILTSSNAIETFLSLNLAKNSKIFVISRKIALKLYENGYNNVFYPMISSALLLKELILEKLSPSDSEILYFCGNFITVDFVKELDPQGFRVQKILSYQVEYKSNFSAEFLAQISSKKIDYVLIFSQNAAKNFYSIVKNHNLLEYFANSKIIGFSDQISAEIKSSGFKNSGNFSEVLALKNFYQ